jgi:imidazolonepropionase-like amidohydrolase
VSEAVARRAGQRGVVVTPTVSWTLGGSGPDSAAAVAVRQGLMKRNIERLGAAGVRFVVGSDWFGSTATHEITDMRAARFWDDATLLRMWAVETPRSIFPDRKIARFDNGFEASFLVLDRDPLADFNAVKSIRLRVKQGCTLP